jgi:hypothetical protein
MILGYMIQIVDQDLSIKDALWAKRIMYPTWDDAVKHIQTVCIPELYEQFGDDITNKCYLDKIKQKSIDSDCMVYAFFQNRSEIAVIYIVPVFSPE